MNRSVLPRQAHSISQDDHGVSKNLISKNALTVLNKLNENGYQSYLVGGGIRDLMLGEQPKDFDVVTNARPDEIKALFGNCRLIGRRFRLAHIHFGRDIIEVATFRGPIDTNLDTVTHHPDTGMIVSDNTYGTLDDDVWRRDFTVNALYYNIADGSVLDYTDGLSDLQSKTLRMIGNPEQRYTEDPVRMLRAIRLAVKLGLTIADDTARPIHDCHSLLQHVSNARLFEEMSKLFLTGCALRTYNQLHDYGLMAMLLPQTIKLAGQSEQVSRLIELALISTDDRVALKKTINPAFLWAIFLWSPYSQELITLVDNGNPMQEARQLAFEKIHKKQIQSVSIPRRFVEIIKQIYDFQPRLQHLNPRYVMKNLSHPRFRAAYDFLALRAESGETAVVDSARWWTDVQAADDEHRQQMIAALPGHKKKRKRRKKQQDG